MSTLSERLREYATDHRRNVQPIVRAHCAEAADEIDRLELRAAELRAALREFGQHDWECDSEYDSGFSCSCGLADALQGQANG